MKKNTQIVRSIKKTTAITMAAVTATSATGLVQISVYAEDSEGKYIADTSPYSTRLKKNYDGDFLIEFGFNKRDASGGNLFTDAMGEKLMDEGKLQLEGGEEISFKDAGITTYIDYAGAKVYQSLRLKKVDVIKKILKTKEDILSKENFSMSVIIPNGDKVEFTIPNKLDPSDREVFANKLFNDSTSVDKTDLEAKIAEAEKINKEDYSESTVHVLDEKLNEARNIKDDENATQDQINTAVSNLDKAIKGLLSKTNENTSNYIANDSPYSTRLKSDYDGKIFMEFGFKMTNEANEKIYTDDMGTSLMENGKIEFVIDGKVTKELSFKKANVLFDKAYNGAINYQAFNIEDMSTIKEFFKDEADVLTRNKLTMNVVIPDGRKVVFNIPNTLDESQRTELAKKLNFKVEDKLDGSDMEDDGSVYNTVTANLVKSKQYGTISMSNATMVNTAEILKDKDGNNKLVLHFKPAEVMGILAYATNLELKGMNTEFVLEEDNSGLCIIDIPNIKEASKVFEGHIYSSVMDADVALKVSNIKKISDVKSQLNKKLEDAKKLLNEKEYYEKQKKDLENAISEAATNENKVNAYIALEKAIANLREKKSNPFENGEMFHLNVKDTSVIGAKSIHKYGKVVQKEGKKPVLTVKYDSYSDWAGEMTIKNIKVLDTKGNEIKSNYSLDKYKTGTLSFEMPYVPAGGVLNVILVEKNGRETKSDILLDYSTIKEGVFRPILIDFIKENNRYLKDDFQTYGDLSEKKDDFTLKSWKSYSDVLNKSREDLKRPDLTQDEIEKDISDLKDAKLNLLYKVKAGSGNEYNLLTKGLNNPNNFYTEGGLGSEKSVKVGWAGSKILFGNEGSIYRVLNNGKTTDENGNVVDSGKILIMAENIRAKKPFSNQEPTSLDDAVRYDNSELRKYLNGEFYNNNFSEIEKKLILESEIDTNEAVGDGFEVTPIEKKITTKDKIFAPDIRVVTNPSYGYASNDGRDTDAAYALRNILVDPLGDVALTAVKPKGRVGGYFRLNSDKIETLPLMYIDASKVVMTLEANKKLSDGLKDVDKTENNLWKLAIKDDTKKLSIKSFKVDKNKVMLDYDSENVDGKDLVAMIVKDGDHRTGNISKLGKIGTISKDGKVEFEVNKFNKDTDKLYVLAMDSEGEKSIYTSNIVNIDLNQDIKEAINEENKDIEKVTKKTYNIPVEMIKYGSTEKSMSNNAIEHLVKVTEIDGKKVVEMVFKPMNIGKIQGHLIKMKVKDSSGNFVDVKVLEKDKDGNPIRISFPVEGNPSKITAEVEVDAMNAISGNSAPQKVDIALNWDNKTNVEEIEINKEDENKKYTRVAGHNRYATSVAISKKFFKKTENVIIASGENSADALVAAPLADMKKAPILLTKKYTMDSDVLEEISRLGAKNVTVIGGHMSVSERVIEELKNKGIKVDRISGADRYETSKKIADEIIKSNSIKKIAVVNGIKNTDALVISGLSTKDNMPVVMIKNDGKNNGLNNKISNWGVNEVIAIGGNKSISEKTYNSINSSTKDRIAGHDRYETALKIAKISYENPKNIFVASGEVSIDALSAGAVTNMQKAPIVLSKKDYMNSNVKDYVGKASGEKYLLGGNDTIDFK